MRRIILCKLVKRVEKLAKQDNCKAFRAVLAPTERYAMVEWFRETEDATLVMIAGMSMGWNFGVEYEVILDGTNREFNQALVMQLRSRAAIVRQQRLAVA